VLAKRTLLLGETSLSIRDDGDWSIIVPPTPEPLPTTAVVDDDKWTSMHDPLSASDLDSNTEPPHAIVLAASSSA